MDLLNCSAKQKSLSSKICCGQEKGIDSGIETSYDHVHANLIECKNKSENIESFVKIEPIVAVSTNTCNKKFRRKPAFWFTNSSILTYEMNSENNDAMREVTHLCESLHDIKFQCPRCRQKMEEPRLLPCLHPICLPCVFELMSKPLHMSSKNKMRDNRIYATINGHEMCPLCDSCLPNVNSVVPPPHYPLQHRLVMDTMRRKLVNRILCDTCTDEVLAFMQCSTCLRNFCSECGRKHEQRNITEARIVKHLMRPLWEATKIRRTILCQIHPTHALKFYCIACQQVTCKECMWSIQHRGHASEDASGVGKRASIYLATILKNARIFLNNLLTQYSHAVFANNDFEKAQNITTNCRYFFILKT